MWKRLKRSITKIKQKSVQILELPNDVVLDLPRLTIVGFLQLYIENHRGVLLFNDEELRLLLKKGQLRIRGKNLVIRLILAEEMMVEGFITQIHYLDKE
ncbi:conserved hypothetical protein [[Clostridium] ultunense Esp]|uniref:sporulation protein YqfC n=1 Tax=Thermicanus aegyptius TaxID=94009 RepID=UPI0002B706B4|nr:sporulation protein YqfC [Thermicanus aegyptius]CCQ96066.1 conserved hypothetical protein [[Clostridium] ultunense Esp]